VAYSAAFRVEQAGLAAVAVPSLVEQLTARELEVLRLIAAGRSNQRIARELFVSLDTAKSTSRTSWASSAPPTAPRPPRARQLGLMP
jgi:LuxR family transcriptional regulator, maltose regulon positive regulatory protein